MSVLLFFFQQGIPGVTFSTVITQTSPRAHFSALPHISLFTFEGDPRIVDEHVHAAVLRFEEVTRRAHARGVRDVQLAEKRRQSFRFQPVHGRRPALYVARRQVHVSVILFAQRAHHRQPDAFVRACHERNFPHRHLACNQETARGLNRHTVTVPLARAF